MRHETQDIRHEENAASLKSQVSSLKSIVVFYPDGKCINAETGANLLELARSANVSIDSSCGGRGICGKCKVFIKYGEVRSKGQGDKGTRGQGESPPSPGPPVLPSQTVLACQSEVVGDVVVEVPVSSQLGELQILQSGAEPVIDSESITPLTQKIDVALNAPSLEDNSGDLERLTRGLRKLDTAFPSYLPACGRDGREGHRASSIEKLQIDLDALRRLPGLLRENDWRVTVTVTNARGTPEVIDVQPSMIPTKVGHPLRSRHNYGLGIDVGTTTIVVHVMDLDTGGSLGVQSEYNGQIKYGEDVIARIIYTNEKEGGLEELKRAVIGTINSLIAELTDSSQISPSDITCVVCAGNTTMTHLLLGIDPTSIRREPYVPVAQWVPVLRAGQMDLNINPNAIVYCFPAVGGYVGGDITAGVLATGMANSSNLSMLIDVGTNGEIVLGNNEWLMCCSCSAGPAFEGCGIEHGMHATAGAIERLEYNPHTDEVTFSTIGGKMPPRGICGSGLIDAVATLLKGGVVDRAGKINLSWQSPRIRIMDDEPQFVFVWGREVGREDDISLTEADMQNLMRSKSAVYAGSTLLLQNLGSSFADVERIYIAGGFGNFLAIENAVVIGLLPDLPLDRIRFVGNTSAAGARMALLSKDARERAEEISRQMTYVELMAEGNRFTDEFVAGLFLPHTNTSLFPSVMEMLNQ